MADRSSPFIRPATLIDLPAIIRIYNQSIPDGDATCDLEPSQLEDRIEWFHTHNRQFPIWVAVIGRRVVGWASITPYSDKKGYAKTVENSLYVDREFRRKGLGKLLLTTTIDESRRLGFHAIIARVFVHNLASLSLHEALGFEPMGCLREVARTLGIYRDVAFLVKLLPEGDKPLTVPLDDPAAPP